MGTQTENDSVVEILVAYATDSERAGARLFTLLKRYEEQVHSRVALFQEVCTEPLERRVGPGTTVAFVVERQPGVEDAARDQVIEILTAASRCGALVLPVLVDVTVPLVERELLATMKSAGLGANLLEPLRARSADLGGIELALRVLTRLRNRELFGADEGEAPRAVPMAGGDPETCPEEPGPEGDIREPYVFISAAPEDHDMARRLHERLEREGVRSFLPDPDRQLRHEPECADGIFRELETATDLAVVASQRQYLDDTWAAYERTTFLEAVHEGRKQGRVTVFFGDGTASPGGLPPELRPYPVLSCSSGGARSFVGTVRPGNGPGKPDTHGGPGNARPPPDRLILVGAVLAVVIVSALIIAALAGALGPQGGNAPPISITHVPPFGSSDPVTGTVAMADGSKVLVYTRVNGSFWGSKPGWDRPFTTISPDGTWQCFIFTGGDDYLASEVVAYLVPANMTAAPEAHGEAYLPYELSAYPLDTELRR